MISLKKAAVYTAIFLCIATVLTALAIQNSAGPEPATQQKAEVFAKKDDREVYTLREGNGNIIIEFDGEVYETGISTSDARAYDRELLRNGIEADSYEEVLMLLEDFNS